MTHKFRVNPQIQLFCNLYDGPKVNVSIRKKLWKAWEALTLSSTSMMTHINYSFIFLFQNPLAFTHKEVCLKICHSSLNHCHDHSNSSISSSLHFLFQDFCASSPKDPAVSQTCSALLLALSKFTIFCCTRQKERVSYFSKSVLPWILIKFP